MSEGLDANPLAPFNQEVNNLDFRDPPRLIWIPVREAAKLLWSENPKLHDLGALVQSIEKYGFQELPRFDLQLPNISGGTGGIKAGNGRIETLAVMERDAMNLPRGLAQDKTTGAWVMPILVGTDADSLNAARAYAIDSNNLTMSGGDFTGFDYRRLWNDNAYLRILENLGIDGELPVSVSGDDLDIFLKGLHFDVPDVTDEEEKEIGTISSFKIEVGNVMFLEEILTATRKFYDDKPDWRCKIVLSS